MKKFLLFAGIIAIVAIASFLIYAAKLPDAFLISRSITIQASPEKIYPYLSDFEKGQQWSPYEQKDPAMKRKFSGAKSGKGSIYHFEGNNEVGTGKLEILEANAPSNVVLQLDMLKPFEASNTIIYTITPKENGSEVTWAMEGTRPFFAKVICTLFNGEKMVGDAMETGLNNLKALTEKQ